MKRLSDKELTILWLTHSSENSFKGFYHCDKIRFVEDKLTADNTVLIRDDADCLTVGPSNCRYTGVTCHSFYRNIIIVPKELTAIAEL